MIWKIVTLAVVLLVVWGMFFRNRRPVRKPPAPIRAHDLIKCAKCGIYLPAHKSCDCSNRA